MRPEPSTPLFKSQPASEPAGRARWRAGAGALLATAALLASCAAPTPPGAEGRIAAEPVRVRVIGFNDLHGNLEQAALTVTVPDPDRPGSPLRLSVGGADAMAGLAQALRKGAPHSLLISSGDQVGGAPLVSSLFRHESTIEAMNLMGVDVATLGNHEFDAGTAELLRLQKGGCAENRTGDPVRSCALGPFKGARFPLISANVQTAQGPLVPPTWVLQAGPVRVGVIGAVTRSTPRLVVPSGIAGLSFQDEADAINAAAARLVAQGIKALVVTLHEGGEIGGPGRPADWNDNQCPGLRGELVPVLKRITPEVDLVLTGHSHQGYNCVVDGRPVMQAVAYGRGLSVVDLAIDPRTGDVLRDRTVARNLPVVNDRVDAALRAKLAAAEPAGFGQALREARPDPAVRDLVQRYAQAAEPLARRVVGRATADFNRRGPGDSALGRLVAEAQWEATRSPETGGSQFALMNPGGLRADLSCQGKAPCDLTYGDIFNVQPFGNSLVVMTLTGAEVRDLLEQQERGGEARAGREVREPRLMSSSSRLTFRWVQSAPMGQRAQDIRVQGRPLDPAASYRVTVNSFMAEGGDGFTALQRGRDRLGGPQDVDALLAYLQRGPVSPTPTRIVITP